MKKFLIILTLFLNQFIHAIDTDTFELYIQYMKFGVASQREDVIDEIKTEKYEAGYFLIEEALIDDKSKDVRGAAAYAMITLEITNSNTWISALSNETDEETLRKVVYAIGVLEIEGTGPLMLSKLSNTIINYDDQYLPAAMFRALGNLEYQPAEYLAMHVLTNMEYEDDIRGAAAVALSTIGSAETIVQLKDTIDNPGESLSIRMYSAYAYGKSGVEDAVDVLVPIVKDEDEELYIRLYAMSGLGFHKTDETVELMMEFALSDNESIRQQAVETLGEMEAEDAIELLKFKAEYDPDDDVQEAAEEALENMGIDLDDDDDEADGELDTDFLTDSDDTEDEEDDDNDEENEIEEEDDDDDDEYDDFINDSKSIHDSEEDEW